MIKLPDGTWINPNYVDMIEAFEENWNGRHPAYVFITTMGDDKRNINCPDYEHACKMRDQIAAAVMENLRLQPSASS